MTTTAYPISEAQVRFISDLMLKRQVPADVAATIRADLPTMTTRQASPYIDLLKTFPYMPKAAAVATGSELTAAYDAVPDARYAIRTRDLELAFPALRLSGDFLFLKVATFNGTRYMRRLTGGGEGETFVTSRFTSSQVLGLLKVMAPRVQEFTQNFGREFTCCGRCGRTLTDPRSREVFLGPECRSVFGL